MRFLGAQPQRRLRLFYAAADATVMPSYYESFGMVALEAMACGSPVVASRVGGLTTTIKDGVTGHLVPEGDPAALAERLTALLADDEARARLGARGRPLGRRAPLAVRRRDGVPSVLDAPARGRFATWAQAAASRSAGSSRRPLVRGPAPAALDWTARTMRRDPFLLTPGPLTTSPSTKAAMLRDWGSRDAGFIEMNARVCERLLDLAGGRGSHVCVPLQGSGTFIVEAMIGTLVPADGKLLILANGAYGASDGAHRRALPARGHRPGDARGRAASRPPPSTTRSARTPRSPTSRWSSARRPRAS